MCLHEHDQIGPLARHGRPQPLGHPKTVCAWNGDLFLPWCHSRNQFATTARAHRKYDQFHQRPMKYQQLVDHQTQLAFPARVHNRAESLSRNWNYRPLRRMMIPTLVQVNHLLRAFPCSYNFPKPSFHLVGPFWQSPLKITVNRRSESNWYAKMIRSRLYPKGKAGGLKWAMPV